MSRARRRNARRKAQQEAYSRRCQRLSEGQRISEEKYGTLEEKYPIQEDKDQKQDALDFSVSGGHFESNRRKH